MLRTVAACANVLSSVSELKSLPFPEPLTFNDSKTFHPDAATGGWHPPLQCGSVGPLAFIGWSEYYLTDASGKAWGQMYSNKGHLLETMHVLYWQSIASALRDFPGVLAYELLNEPWVGDHIENPRLLLQAGAAEKETVGPFMQRAEKAIRAIDPDTRLLFAPAEVNNRFMRPVGYNSSFMPGEPMAFHVYCITGTDAAGPTTPLTKELCHVNDGFQVETRWHDLTSVVRTAGFVTEFGGVSDSTTGRAEVRYVADKLDNDISPPISWTFWAGIPSDPLYQKELARTYAPVVAGTLQVAHFDADSKHYSVQFAPGPTGDSITKIFTSPLHYPDGTQVSFLPEDCCTYNKTGSFVNVAVHTIPSGTNVSVMINPQK